MRRVQLVDDRQKLLAIRLVAAQQDTVGALICNDRGSARSWISLLVLLRQCRQGANHFGRAGVDQAHHFDFAVAGLIHLPDQLLDAHDVGRAIGNDQHVAGRIGGQMAPLRNQWAQDRHQLRGGNILDRIDVGDDVINRQARATAIGHAAIGAGIGFRHDLDRLSGRNRGKTLHLKNGEESGVDACGGHRA